MVQGPLTSSLLMFYLPESGRQHPAWCSLVGRYSILSRGQKPHVIKGCILATFLYLWILGPTPGGWVCWEQGYLCPAVRLPTTLLCSLPPTRNCAPHCMSLPLTSPPLCRLVPFPLNGLLFCTLDGWVMPSGNLP